MGSYFKYWFELSPGQDLKDPNVQYAINQEINYLVRKAKKDHPNALSITPSEFLRYTDRDGGYAEVWVYEKN